MTISRVSPVIFWSWPKWAVRWCVAFSTITIAWSTRMPIEMAMPESDMMFEAMSKCRIRMNDDQHRQRQRHADHERAAEVHQDQQDRERGDDHLVHERLGERLDRPVDQPRAVVERHDPHALRAGPAEAPGSCP